MVCEYCGDLIPNEREDEFKLIEKYENSRFTVLLCSQGCFERYLEDSPNSVRHKVVEGGMKIE